MRFDVPLPALPAGRYRVFADLVHESGFAKTLVTSVDLPAPALPAPADTAGDDGLYLGSAAAGDKATLPDGATVTWDRGSAPLVAGAPAALSFTVREPTGQPASLEPYLGMPGHAVVVREDGAVFIHLHPMGTVSPAAQETFTLRQQGDTATGAIGSRIASQDSAMAAGMTHAVSRRPDLVPIRLPPAGPIPDLGPGEAERAGGDGRVRRPGAGRAASLSPALYFAFAQTRSHASRRSAKSTTCPPASRRNTFRYRGRPGTNSTSRVSARRVSGARPVSCPTSTSPLRRIS